MDFISIPLSSNHDTGNSSVGIEQCGVRHIFALTKTYGKITRKYLFSFHLVHHKHKDERYQQMFETMEKVSYYFTLYLMTRTMLGVIMFNVIPFYQNYTNGVFSGRLEKNVTIEYSVYFNYPSFGSFPKPAKKTTTNNIKLATHLYVQMFDEAENETVHEKLIECVNHHRMIIDFGEEVFTFYGPMVGLNYVFHLASCCLVLFQCSQGSENLMDSVYETPWEYMNAKNRRSVCFLLNRMQSPVQVMSMGLARVGVTTMAAILKTIFSYFAFLKSLD